MSPHGYKGLDGTLYNSVSIYPEMSTASILRKQEGKFKLMLLLMDFLHESHSLFPHFTKYSVYILYLHVD